MRHSIVHPGAGQLKYEIREIVGFGRSLAEWGVEPVWENIGDPVKKGEPVAPWIKEIVAEAVADDLSYAYSETEGASSARDFLAGRANARGGARVEAGDIVFFNGLGDAVAKVFGFLRRESRVLGPSPAYSTLSSAEAAHSGYSHLTYKLDPCRDWKPDLDDVELKVKYNDSIAGILLINPNNPTGAVYDRATLEGFVEIARKYGLFLVCDETYASIVYPGNPTAALSEVIEDVPGIALRSISKEFPWPGARCGWIEVYNRNACPSFAAYIESLVAAKRLEVCSTSLPQIVIPRIMGDARYPGHLERRTDMFAARAAEAEAAFSGVPGIRFTPPKGAFYGTVVFEPGALPERIPLPIGDPSLAAHIEEKSRGLERDKRFVYALLGSEGICVVPLSGFASDLPGFRFTLLEHDDARRARIFGALAKACESAVSGRGRAESLSAGPVHAAASALG